MQMRSYCFLSNYLTHHQLPFCLEMMKLTQGQFTFVETEPLPQERSAMGYATLGDQYPFVISAYRSEELKNKALKIANQADVVIIGSAPDLYIRQRLKMNKLTFRYSERIFKKKNRDLLRWVKYTWKNLPYRNKELYYMLSSAYAAHDYLRCGARAEKLFKWGYFPETKAYSDTNALFAQKTPGSILWVGRMLSLKHPETAIRLAAKLKNAGYDFRLDMIGNGTMEEKIRGMIEELGLQEHVHLLGAMKPEQVRNEMEKHALFLFTSDFNEGWGAVLNEAMNSGCAVVASHACGSVPFMVEQGVNGYAYEYGNESQLCSLVQQLLDDPVLGKKMGESAVKTIEQVWNAEEATARFLKICDGDAKGKTWSSGPMSGAEAIEQDNMFSIF